MKKRTVFSTLVFSAILLASLQALAVPTQLIKSNDAVYFIGGDNGGRGFSMCDPNEVFLCHSFCLELDEHIYPNIKYSYTAHLYRNFNLAPRKGYQSPFQRIIQSAKNPRETIGIFEQEIFPGLTKTMDHLSKHHKKSDKKAINSDNAWSDTGDVHVTNLEKYQDQVTGVPEPTTMLLFGTGILGLAGLTRRWRVNLIDHFIPSLSRQTFGLAFLVPAVRYPANIEYS